MKYLLNISIVLLVVFYHTMVIAQSPVIDSLAFLLKTDAPDTAKVEHLNKLGWEFMYVNPDTSIILSEQALLLATSISLETKDTNIRNTAKRQIGLSYNCLGVYYWIISDYAESIKFHEKAMEIRKEMGNKIGQAKSLNNLGLVYKAQGDYSGALNNYFEALKIAIELGNKDLISTDLSNIGTAYHDMKDYKKAIDFYFLAVRFLKEVGDKQGLSMTYSYIGTSYADLGDVKTAIEYYNKGLSISKEIDNPYLLAVQLNNLGEIYGKDRKFELALVNYQLALPQALIIGDMGLIYAIYGNMGSDYFRSMDYLNGEKYLKKSLAIAEEIGALPGIESNTKMLSEIYAETGRIDLAYKFQSRYLSVHDSLFNENQTREIGKMEARHEVENEARNKKLAEDEKIRAEKAKKSRMDLLQYSGIVFLLLLVGVFILILGFKKVSPQIASAVTFLAFLLLFEFLLVLLDPLVDKWSHGMPAYKLLLNGIMALMIFPIHAYFERFLKRRLVKMK